MEKKLIIKHMEEAKNSIYANWVKTKIRQKVLPALVAIEQAKVNQYRKEHDIDKLEKLEKEKTTNVTREQYNLIAIARERQLIPEGYKTEIEEKEKELKTYELYIKAIDEELKALNKKGPPRE